MNTENKKYYASLEYRISQRTIERAYEGTPFANAAGRIDFYKENMGKMEGACGKYVNSRREAELYFKRWFPNIFEEEETRIVLKKAL